MTESLTVEIATDADVCTVSIAGDLDPSTSPHLEGELRASAFTSQCHTLVLDLSRVSFIDSSGLGVILLAHKLMRDRDGTLVLRQPTEIVERLLEITALTDELTIE